MPLFELYSKTQNNPALIRQSVGARVYKSILQDPCASEKELRSLAKKRPLDALQHPNCPANLWWEIAPSFPLQALDSLAGPLMLLSEPDLWSKLEDRWGGVWTNRASQALDDDARRLFMADCAEHVLGCFEAPPWPRWWLYPEREFFHWNTPRRSIAAARDFVAGRMTEEDLSIIREAAFDAWRSCRKNSSAYFAAAAAALATQDVWRIGLDVPTQTQYAAQATSADLPTREEADAAYAAETKWQWHRLLYYLRKGKAGVDIIGSLHNQEILAGKLPTDKSFTVNQPMASHKSIENLAKKDLLAALRHPNASPAQLERWLDTPWQDLNRQHLSIELLVAALKENPVLDMLYLESPAAENPLLIKLWSRDEQSLWTVMSRMPAKMEHHFYVQAQLEIVAALLPNQQEMFPSDHRLTDAISMVQQYPKQAAGRADILRALNECDQVRQEAINDGDPTMEQIAEAVGHAVRATIADQKNRPLFAILAASHAVATAACRAAYMGGSSKTYKDSWQWHRAKADFLRWCLGVMRHYFAKSEEWRR